MHNTIEVWKALVAIGTLALPVTFVLYWAVDSFKRIPTVWHKFWQAFANRTAQN